MLTENLPHTLEPFDNKIIVRLAQFYGVELLKHIPKGKNRIAVAGPRLNEHTQIVLQRTASEQLLLDRIGRWSGTSRPFPTRDAEPMKDAIVQRIDRPKKGGGCKPIFKPFFHILTPSHDLDYWLDYANLILV